MIVIPDDFPSVFSDSEAHALAKTLGEVRVFTERGAEDEAELARRIGTARVAVNIRAHACFTDAVFAACPDLKIISIWGTGTDNVDLAAAQRRGIAVCNIPGVNAYAVAEHTIALMLTVARRIPAIDSAMRGGDWPRDMLTQLHGKTLAVFGSGSIGARVAELGRAFGMEVLTWSARSSSTADKMDAVCRADFISLHLRLTPQTRGFIGSAEFATMKPSAMLFNTGRGPLVDHDALLEALGSGRIAGAGLDVFHDEPLKPGDALTTLANTVLSPHNAGQTSEVRRDGLMRTMENVAHFLAGTPQNLVTPSK
jgi:phosphoglycerate dehydrogenase-like enzyme